METDTLHALNASDRSSGREDLCFSQGQLLSRVLPSRVPLAWLGCF